MVLTGTHAWVLPNDCSLPWDPRQRRRHPENQLTPLTGRLQRPGRLRRPAYLSSALLVPSHHDSVPADGAQVCDNSLY